MARITCEFFSDVLGISTSMTVLLPEAGKHRIGMAGSVERETYPVLYLLHGLSDDDSTWTRRSAIERYVAKLGLIVVMPNGYRGFYTNMQNGYRYWDYIAHEVPKIAEHYFPISKKRSETFVAGLSMGGYGAMKLALNFPERFAAAASFSGALDIAEHLKAEVPEGADPAVAAMLQALRQEQMNTFGSLEDFIGSENDLFAVAKSKTMSAEYKPRLYQACGTEDFLYQQNINFRDFIINETDLNVLYDEGPGAHTWEYWDVQVQKALQFFMGEPWK
ncbi:alpha/beta hydrolase [Culicoidibacter larvae]|uniref:Esterase family protein n=1 Tax=Culicoidibacter larvae TaxID=2579976 RepID=A0A5R8QID4_9FIRM|nr:alpha/beta hydrolase family protein [Culicoidibacter larvae]TLG77486.1 esterase family protein [Culicoidibacter larvae]